MSQYSKTIAAVITGAIGWATLVVNSAPAAITASEWIAGGTSLAIALGVYLVPNSGT
jgi:hypothetical protein